jgi:hypothetical protein
MPWKYPQILFVIILFDGAFKYGDGAKFLLNAGTNVEPLCRIQ